MKRRYTLWYRAVLQCLSAFSFYLVYQDGIYRSAQGLVYPRVSSMILML